MSPSEPSRPTKKACTGGRKAAGGRMRVEAPPLPLAEEKVLSVSAAESPAEETPGVASGCALRAAAATRR